MPLLPEWITLDPQQVHQYLHQLADLPHTPSTQSGETVSDFIALPKIDLSDIDLNIHDTVSSTNTVLGECLRAGAPAKTVVIARQQSAGKGQWGRQWRSPLGGLYLSMAFRPNCAVTLAPQITLATAWGLTLALRKQNIPVWIKWPNDLVVQLPPNAPLAHKSSVIPDCLNQEKAGLGNGAHLRIQPLFKLGGILTETRIQGDKITEAIVGVGINGANPVPSPGISLQTLGEIMGDGQSRLYAGLNRLAATAIWGILNGWQHWQDQGIKSILPQYNNYLIHRGQWVSMNMATQCLKGQILGVTASGNLRLCPQNPLSPLHQIKPTYPGTLSKPSSSSGEMQVHPGTIQLGYCLYLENWEYMR